MHNECPDYYRITPTTDLNRWAAGRLNTANWYHHEYAILLNILWAQVLRYVIRLPFKGISEPDMVRDIDKAITQLQDLRAVLVPPVDAPPCPVCGGLLEPESPPTFGDYYCYSCRPDQPGCTYKHFWQHELDVALVPPPLEGT